MACVGRLHSAGARMGEWRVFGSHSLRIGSLFGIPIEIDITWLVVFVLVSATLAFGYFPGAFPDRAPVVDVLSGVITALLFFASILFHELSHSLVARAGGLRISKVTLFIFGGVAQMEDEPSSPGREFVMALAGPAASLVLAAGLFLGYRILEGLGASDTAWAPLEYLAIMNLSVALFNLLPGFPLDGGRLLRATLWWLSGSHIRATRWAARAGQFIGYTMIASAVFGVLRGTLDLIWFGLLGWFITTLADSSLRQQVLRERLSGVSVGSVMSPDPVTVPARLTVEELANERLLGDRHTRYPVVEDGVASGIVSLRDVRRVARHEWPSTTVGLIADRDLERLIVGVDEPLYGALDRIVGEDTGALLVVHDGRLVGILTRADIVSWLRQDSRAR